MAVHWLRIAVFCALFCKISAATCLVKTNSSSSIPGYYYFPTTFFPTPTAAKYAGLAKPPDVAASCFKLCATSKFGFYVRRILFTDSPCYCLTSAPDYTVKYTIGEPGFFSKSCPKFAVPPPRVPPPKRPPPPAKPSGCPLAFNSSSPAGYFYFENFNDPKLGYIYLSFTFTATAGVDVWPFGATKCQQICKAYPDGFAIGVDKYSNTQECFCLKGPLVYKPSTGVGFFNYFYAKSCPAKAVSPPPPRKLVTPPPPKKLSLWGDDSSKIEDLLKMVDHQNTIPPNFKHSL